jgi:hypothetical protein
VLRRKKPQIIARFLTCQQALTKKGVDLGQSKIIPQSGVKGKREYAKRLGRRRIMTHTCRSANFAPDL